MSKTILLADDSLTIQKVVELTFMEEDFDVVSVSDGDHALTKLDELTPALVIADVHMPGASGYEVCSRVKSDHPGVPVLLLVGTFELFDEEEARTAGANAHLKKPFDSRELLQMVERLVGTDAGQVAESEPAPGEMAEAVESPETSIPELAEPEQEWGFEVSSSSEAPPGAVVEAEIESMVPEEVLSVADPMGIVSADIGPAAEPEGPTVVEEPPETPAPPAAAEGVVADQRLSEEDVERIARKVVEYLGEDIVREISWEVIPDLAEIVIKNRLRELEEQVD